MKINSDAPQIGPDGDLRRCILDSARHLLVRDGYRNLSMRRIARAIGYSATSIYLHFESKDDLFHTLIDEGMERLYHRLQETAAEHASDPRARLEALARTFARFGLDNPEYYEVMFLLRPESMERYPVRMFRRARRNLGLLQETLREGAERGVFAVEDPRVAANAHWSALHGAVSLLLSRRVDAHIDPEDFLDTAVRQALRGVAAPASPLQGSG